MGLIFSIFMLGLVASLSPATIVVFILVLGTARAQVNAGAFLVGWAVSLTVVFILSYVLGAARISQEPSGRTGLLGLQVLLGLALLAAGFRKWRRRTEPLDSPQGWGSELLTGRLRDMGPRGAALVGVLKQPWAVTTAAAVLVVHHHEPLVVALIAFACFTVVSTASVGLMYLYYSRHPAAAIEYLTELRDRAIVSGPTVFAVLAMLLGAFLVVDALVGSRSS